MNDNTSYREKGRAVFLAAIMVLSVVALSASFAGSAAAAHDPDAEEVTVGEIPAIWEGQTVLIDGFNDSETVEFEATETNGDGETFAQIGANNSTVEFNTEGLAPGTWEVEGVSSGETDEFSLRVQQLRTFEFDPASTGGTSTLTIDSLRQSYDVVLSAEGLDAQDLNDSLGQGSIVHEDSDDEAYVVTVENNDLELDVDTSELETGEYQFEAEVTDTGATASANLTVEEETDEAVQFTDSYEEEAGDVANVELDVSNAGDSAYVVMTSGTVDGEAVAHLDLADYDGDTVTLGVNTYNLSHGNAMDAFSAPDEDVSVGADTQYNATADAEAPHMGDLGEDRWPGGYAFTLQSYTENPVDSDARADDRSRLTLSDRSTGDVTVGVAPGSVDITEDTEISDLSEDVTQRDTVAEGDYVVAEVQTSGIYGYIDSVEDFQNEDVNFYLYQETQGTFGGTQETTLNVSDEIGDATVLMDSDNDQFVVAFQPGQVGELETGDSWDAVFEVGTDNPYNTADEAETASSSFSFEERNLEFAGDSDELQVDAQQDSQIVAETNAAPGTEGDMYVVLQDATENQDLTVDENGQLAGSFDFSDRSEGEQIESIEATLFGNNNVDDMSVSTSGVFGDGSAPSFSASGDAPSSVNVDDDAQLDATVTNDGEAAGSANITVTVGGEEVASENVELESGGEWSESFDIPTDEAGDVEWEVNAGDSSDSGTVTVEEEDDTGEGDTTEPDDDTENETDDEGDDGGDSDDEGQPGFGVVVALFALFGAALLALRRQN